MLSQYCCAGQSACLAHDADVPPAAATGGLGAEGATPCGSATLSTSTAANASTPARGGGTPDRARLVRPPAAAAAMVDRPRRGARARRRGREGGSSKLWCRPPSEPGTARAISWTGEKGLPQEATLPTTFFFWWSSSRRSQRRHDHFAPQTSIGAVQVKLTAKEPQAFLFSPFEFSFSIYSSLVSFLLPVLPCCPPIDSSSFLLSSLMNGFKYVLLFNAFSFFWSELCLFFSSCSSAAAGL